MSPRQALVTVLAAVAVLGVACDEPLPDSGPPTTTRIGAAEVAAATAPEATTALPGTHASTTTSTQPALTTSPPVLADARRWGVVLIDPLIDDSLNLRERPGVTGPILTTLHRTQTGIVPTGRVSPVSGRPWYEVTAHGVTGWVHGRYVTAIWPVDDVGTQWDWRGAVDRFAQALATRQGLPEAVTWRGFYAVDGGGGLHWWPPAALPRLVTDDTRLRWNFGAASWEETGLIHTFADVVAIPFLEDYYDHDAELAVAAVPLGTNAVIPAVAVSTAFANFSWVAVHDPVDNPDFGGLDWSTWLVYLELDGDTPRVVGVQQHQWEP